MPDTPDRTAATRTRPWPSTFNLSPNCSMCQVVRTDTSDYQQRLAHCYTKKCVQEEQDSRTGLDLGLWEVEPVRTTIGFPGRSECRYLVVVVAGSSMHPASTMRVDTLSDTGAIRPLLGACHMDVLWLYGVLGSRSHCTFQSQSV